MAEKSANEIPRGVRDQYEKGLLALERSNLDYAIELLLGVLKAEPAFLAGRDALRKAGQKKAGLGGGRFMKFVNSASSSPALAKARLITDSQPLEAMFVAEQVISNDPKSSLAHDIFAKAAVVAGLPRSALLSLEAMRQENPADKDVSIRLSEAYTAIGENDKAESVFAALMKHHPHDPHLNEMAKNISASRTLNEGGYQNLADGTGSFRQALKNKDEATRLEQESRITKDAAQAESLIEQYLARLATEPENLKLLKNIAELYAQQKDFYNAIHYYNLIEQTPGAMDAALEQARNEVIVKRFNQVIEQLDPALEDHEQQKADLTAQRDDFVLSDCLARVERYPTDKAIRFELGMIYFNLGRLPEALPEFQQAENNAHKRLQAMHYSARCLAARNMNDMAARKLQTALKEKIAFDDERKELLYTLGCVLEKSGKKAEAMAQFEQIYEVDMKFRDVGKRVDDYHAGEG
ncbi:MAG: tetratricopeptide repeat protein [Verrucomicrobia bacterium]|nr:tetratricopeptide repeat protein [Verrucomicrobiota bacterium]